MLSTQLTLNSRRFSECWVPKNRLMKRWNSLLTQPSWSILRWRTLLKLTLARSSSRNLTKLMKIDWSKPSLQNWLPTHLKVPQTKNDSNFSLPELNISIKQNLLNTLSIDMLLAAKLLLWISLTNLKRRCSKSTRICTTPFFLNSEQPVLQLMLVPASTSSPALPLLHHSSETSTCFSTLRQCTSLVLKSN